MSLFGAIINTVVNVATLPVEVAKDTVMGMADAIEGKDIGHRTKEQLEKIKEEAQE